jgi:hypothetical protein
MIFVETLTQLKLKFNFEYAAGLFDEIMIDDFWFTDCTCSECEATRNSKTVIIGDKTYPVPGDRWEVSMHALKNADITNLHLTCWVNLR